MLLSYNDRQHSYWFTPDGEDAKAARCKGVSTLAKIPDDTYNLDKWGKRQVALGMALAGEEIRERALAHHDDKSELDGIAEEAMRAAKSGQAAARGTAIHRILERHDLGEEIIDTPDNRAFRAAYEKALDAAGLTVVPEYVERIVVHPKRLVAGRLDRIYKRRRDGKFVIGDVKSGTNAVKYPHSTAVQLATYANAELMAGDIPRWGGSTEEFTKMPEKLDLKWAYVVHAPSPDEVAIVKIDIKGGWDIAQKAIFPILDWRKRKDLIVPVGTTSVADLMERATPERLSWVQGRLADLAGLDNADTAKRLVAERWPSDVPTPRTIASSGDAWNEYHVDALDVMLQTVEKDCAAGFPVRNPAHKDMEAA